MAFESNLLFLSDRVLILSYKGSISSPKDLPAGAPQGTLLGVVCFIVKFNGALLRPAIPRPQLTTEAMKAKYMDDISIAAKSESSLQILLNALQQFSSEHCKEINHSKSKIMHFSRSRQNADGPKLKIGDQGFLEEISSFKLLGIMISINLKWHKILNIYVVRQERKYFH